MKKPLLLQTAFAGSGVEKKTITMKENKAGNLIETRISHAGNSMGCSNSVLPYSLGASLMDGWLFINFFCSCI